MYTTSYVYILLRTPSITQMHILLPPPSMDTVVGVLLLFLKKMVVYY
jgi:hypothetical protein